MSKQQQQEKTVREIYQQTQEEFKNIRNNCKRNADPILQRNDKYVITTYISTYPYSRMFPNQKSKQKTTTQ